MASSVHHERANAKTQFDLGTRSRIVEKCDDSLLRHARPFAEFKATVEGLGFASRGITLSLIDGRDAIATEYQVANLAIGTTKESGAKPSLLAQSGRQTWHAPRAALPLVMASAPVKCHQCVVVDLRSTKESTIDLFGLGNLLNVHSVINLQASCLVTCLYIDTQKRSCPIPQVLFQRILSPYPATLVRSILYLGSLREQSPAFVPACFPCRSLRTPMPS